METSISIELHHNNLVKRLMWESGFYAALIWFQGKNQKGMKQVDDMLEMKEILEMQFLEVISNPPLDESLNLFVDILERKDEEVYELYKLFGIFSIINLHNCGRIFYYNKENIENIRNNLKSVAQGIIDYIDQQINFYYMLQNDSQ